MGKSKGKMKKMSRQQQKAVGASMAESGINMNAQQVVAQPAQQIVAQPVQQMTNVPPQQANTLGTAQPVFNPQAQQMAQGIYGGIDQRQNAVRATPIFQKNQFGNTKEEQANENKPLGKKSVNDSPETEARRVKEYKIAKAQKEAENKKAEQKKASSKKANKKL